MYFITRKPIFGINDIRDNWKIFLFIFLAVNVLFIIEIVIRSAILRQIGISP